MLIILGTQLQLSFKLAQTLHKLQISVDFIDVFIILFHIRLLVQKMRGFEIVDHELLVD